VFSGIVEALVVLEKKEHEGTNTTFWFRSDLTPELKIDQSIAHNGVCLTVTEIKDNSYSVTAIQETLRLTNLGDLKIGDEVNVERCIRLNDRLDGHMVQGHVDGKAIVTRVEDKDGSWEFDFEFDKHFPSIEGRKPSQLVIQKGSITINGTSLTVTQCSDKGFGVAIIPYTYEHTNFKDLKVGDQVNIELDVLGKYMAKLVR
jgi:riboflavin synthase